ncbi:MAG: hypothetical protein BGO09_01860 [Bacteroidetes bacterium 47-18]|nr:MAG: hypothetical protein BGO09_01860 [Bacteroidetes bacterium 47-18]
MKYYYVYIVQCADNSYYTGITNNLEKRIAEHNEGTDPKCYTFKRRPVILVFQQQFTDVNQAIAFEKQVKGWSRKKKEAIIRNEWYKLPDLSKNRRNI